MNDFYANPGKKVSIEVGGATYVRHAIKTHFVTPGESYIALVRQYVSPLYQEGDILSLSEKIVALCKVASSTCRRLRSAGGRAFFRGLSI